MKITDLIRKSRTSWDEVPFRLKQWALSSTLQQLLRKGQLLLCESEQGIEGQTQEALMLWLDELLREIRDSSLE